MKKIILGASLASMLFIGCSSTSTNGNAEDIHWKYTRDLPAPKGFKEQVGVAGPLAGHIGEYIVVAGGANFPYESVLKGGAKVVYPDLYLMKETESGLELVKHAQLKKEIGYGSTISKGDAIYYIGGTHSKGVSKNILKITLNDEKDNVIVKSIGELPFDYHSGVADIYESSIYVITGKQDGKNSKGFYKFNLVTKEIEKLPDFPGVERSQSVGQILSDGKNEKLYVFGGGTGVAFTDGYAYNLKNKTWEKVSDVKYNGKEISLLGGNSIKLNKNEMMVIGGFNKEVWDDANKQLGSLKDEDLKSYKEEYFNRDPQDFNWNQNMMIYNAKNNSWRSGGEVPFLAPCGEGLVKVGNRIYSINGEIKPGVRSKKIYVGEIK